MQKFFVGTMLMWEKPGENVNTVLFHILLPNTHPLWVECGDYVDVGKPGENVDTVLFLTFFPNYSTIVGRIWRLNFKSDYKYT